MMEDKMSPKTKAQEPKKTFSLKFRFIATVIIAMLSITIFVGGLSVYEVDKYIQTQAEEFVKVTCDNEGAQINDKLSNMEKSVKIMESYLMDFFFSKEDVEDKAVQEKVVKSADEMFVDVAKHTSTSGAVSYYFRFDPAISDGKAGLFYSKINGSTDFVSLEPTDITIYEKNDTEHVGWFWQPYEAGTPIWMDPYYNQNNEILMISYVIPMYYEDKFIGVVGMDFDYDVLSDMVNGIKIYDNGFAHLEVDGTVISSSDSALEAKINSGTKKYLRMSNDLVNGMTLVLSASYDDIRHIRYEISLKITLVVLILSAVFMLIAIVVVRRIVNPLNKLTKAAVKLSTGDYNVDIIQTNTYEIKLLSMAFGNMTNRLREREEHLRLLANRDSLTGLKNTTAYATCVANFDKEIENKTAEFGVVVLDLNELKETNDKYGHDIGNKLIIAAADTIAEAFKGSSVYRIGGDEFLTVVQNENLENCAKLIEKMNTICLNTFVEDEGIKLPLSIASGFARFDAEVDKRFTDVFKRADRAMYKNKNNIKAATE